MDLLAILPYYIEIALQKDTVSPLSSPLSDPSLAHLIRVAFSLRSFAFPYFARFACFASSVRSGTIVPFYCTCLFPGLLASVRRRQRIQDDRGHVPLLPTLAGRASRSRILRTHGGCRLQHPYVRSAVLFLTTQAYMLY